MSSTKKDINYTKEKWEQMRIFLHVFFHEYNTNGVKSCFSKIKVAADVDYVKYRL